MLQKGSIVDVRPGSKYASAILDKNSENRSLSHLIHSVTKWSGTLKCLATKAILGCYTLKDLKLKCFAIH